ncbi:hypothetical protein Salat_1058300 [Sesamum alatum]|uniref:Uncharacterized protein n=1 Tax=Sesamum alatum TaxID=300844 RepID=A0AAE1YND3_9LAMI|nr:hypothetical protein Salat_1058300 [Sesamum alatum]
MGWNWGGGGETDNKWKFGRAAGWWWTLPRSKTMVLGLGFLVNGKVQQLLRAETLDRAQGPEAFMSPTLCEVLRRIGGEGTESCCGSSCICWVSFWLWVGIRPTVEEPVRVEGQRECVVHR